MNLSVAARILITIVAIVLTIYLVPIVTLLAIDGKIFLRESITALFRPFALEGEERLEGLIGLCLYLFAATLIIKYVWRK
jgi:hypothetical protein